MYESCYAVVNPNTKLAGLFEVLTLAEMGRRVVMTRCETDYETLILRRGAVEAPNWSDNSTRARLMPRDRDGRFVALAGIERIIQRAVRKRTNVQPAPLIYLPRPIVLPAE